MHTQLAQCPSGGIGRRTGLKIQRLGVPVRLRPRVQKKTSIIIIEVFFDLFFRPEKRGLKTRIT